MTEPGSVARTRSTCPLVSSESAFFARRIGSGQLSPRTSRSLSKVAVVIVRSASKGKDYIPKPQPGRSGSPAAVDKVAEEACDYLNWDVTTAGAALAREAPPTYSNWLVYVAS